MKQAVKTIVAFPVTYRALRSIAVFFSSLGSGIQSLYLSLCSIACVYLRTFLRLRFWGCLFFCSIRDGIATALNVQLEAACRL